MKVSLSTGGAYDFLALKPDTIEEAADLVFVGLSKFPKWKHLIELYVSVGPIKSFELRIRLSEIEADKGLSPEIREAIDQTP